MSNWMGYIMSVREDTEINIMKKASFATTDVFNKYLKDQIMEVIDR